MTSTEFLDWVAYLDADANAFHREDYFLANIATEIRRSYVAKPASVKLSDFLIQFKGKVKQKKMDVKERMKRSKSFWGTVTSPLRKKE